MGDGPADRTRTSFVWATGMEDTFMVHPAPGRRRLDELELVGHYDAWREDIDLAAGIGFGAMRCGIPWYRVEPWPGTFDWSWTDQVVPYLVERGLEPIADLVHYGTPLWMPDAFADPDFPSRVAAYTAAFADRYAGLVAHYTPVNEPAVTALICGFAGRWPPYLTGHAGYVRVLNAVCRGIVGQVAAIRAGRPDAIIVHVEGTGFWIDAGADAGATGTALPERIYAALDLLTGRVDPAHELYGYLTHQGLTDADFGWYADHAIVPDIIGLNYYPDGSVHRLAPDGNGSPDSIRREWGGGHHLAAAIRQFAARYGRPIFVSETGCNERSAAWVEWSDGKAGDASVFRRWWLDELAAVLRRSMAEGAPVWGCTWWPLVDAVSWDYRDGTEPLPAYLEPGGLIRAEPDGAGHLARQPLLVADHMSKVIASWT